MTAKDAIDKALAEHREWIAAPYDGVLGTLPDWMPRPLAIEFSQIRQALLGPDCHDCGTKHTPSQIRQWLTAYRAAARNTKGFRSLPTYPPAHAHDLRDLAYVESIANLGSKRGLGAYLGTGADKVYRSDVHAQRQRRIARQPRGDGLARIIDRLLRQKPITQDALTYVRRKLYEKSKTEIDGVYLEGIEDDTIEWHDANGRARNTAVSALKHRVSRAVKKLGQN